MLRTKITILALLATTMGFEAMAQTKQRLNIDEATVFLVGAELVSSTEISLVKGENEFLFTNVAGDVNAASLNVKATNGIVVESATFQNNYLSEEAISPKAKEIKDSMELMSEYISTLNTHIAVITEQVTVLEGNRKVSGDNTGLSVAELTKMLDLINTRLETYLTNKHRETDKLTKANERWAKLKKQLDEEQKKDFQPGGQLLVKFYAKEATKSAIQINYVVPHAGWTPTYDIMADIVNGPVKLYYKANITQNSGVKWNNVHLSLSTGNPQEGVNAPVLSPWYLAFYVPPVYNNYANNMAMAPAPPAMYKKSMRAEQASEDVFAGSNTTMNQYVSVDNSGINTSFDIELPYTIPSDGQQHLVAIKKYELPATYRYFAIPKLDKDAFLQAEITNWEDLNLLPGTSNIFYEGTYVGQGTLDVRNLKDTMTISLGRDKKIVVKRERDSKLRSVKTIGTNIRESYNYNITVRNARKEKINLIVQDQQPVSNDKDIVLEDVDGGGSEFDATTGLMSWTLNLAPNESKKVTFGFTAKYPKGKVIANLK